MSLASRPMETLDGQSLPGVRQFSIFLDNQVGQLLRLTQIIDCQDIKILGLSIVDAPDYAVVRLLCDSPDEATIVLRNAGYSFSVNEVIVVALPAGKRGLLAVWQCLLSAEINVGTCYPLLPPKLGPVLAISVDNLEIATDTLIRNKFEVLSEADLK
ncbi:MAG TPA: acetolactate synthase [Phycisphaerae bacterium]|nr:acetolactate synthase [Phycisphaerae bacterium]